MSNIEKAFHLSLFEYLKTKTAGTDLESSVKTLAQGLGVNLQEKSTVDLFALFKNSNPTLSNSFDSALEEKFLNYKELLTKRGYFNGVNEGSAEYEERLQKARARFLNKFQSPSGATSKSSEPALDPYAHLSHSERAAKGDEHKIAGNEYIRTAKYPEAIEEYTTAINYDPSNAIYYANRALAYQKLSNHKQAIQDCLKSIDYNPKYAKAYSRLGNSYIQLKEYQKAEKAFENGLLLEPEDKSLKEDLAKAKSLSAGGFSPEMFQNFMGGAEGMGGAGAGAGGMPNFMEMLNNPQFMNMAAQFVQNNPELLNMAQQMAQNPEMLRQFFGGNFPGMGGGGPGGFGGGPGGFGGGPGGFGGGPGGFGTGGSGGEGSLMGDM